MHGLRHSIEGSRKLQPSSQRRHAVVQCTLATLGAGALATARGLGAAGAAGVPLASTGVSDSPAPEAGAAGPAGAAAAAESVLEESEAPAL